ncbi:hypothetical protein [Arcobacter arenosus]|uniref:hypothetical protein n=1 Tax=Arcobacter arenosus TaxID=2576037 RepID=UPI003BA877E7
MALFKCKECGKEISVTIDKCLNCGSKKPFKGTLISREQTKKLTYKERKNFEKLGGEVTKGTLEKIGSAIFIVLIVLFIYNITKSESPEDKRKRMEQLTISIKNIPFEQVQENLNAYKQLSEYYPENNQYKEKYNFYQSRLNLMGDCQYNAVQNNKASLNNPSTYNDEIADKYLYMNWNTVNQYEYQSSFSGKNSFGVEQKFVARYVCDYNNGKTKIKRMFLKKAID